MRPGVRLRIRAWTFGLVGAVVLLLPIAVYGSVPTVSSIASTGDSITRAYNTGFFPFTDNPSASWSTGTSLTVQSQYTRLLALNPLIRGKNYNDAKSGAKMIDLNGQMAKAVSQSAEYVTVLMGGNDVCTSSEGAMTLTSDFEARFRAAMTTIMASPATKRVFVSSIPSVLNLRNVLKNNSSARAAWSFFKICQSMLANPLSDAQADVDRRTRVDAREREFNAVLKAICEAAANAARCTYDADAVFNYAFIATDVSTRDYFHPSLAGQKTLARVTWDALVAGAP